MTGGKSRKSVRVSSTLLRKLKSEYESANLMDFYEKKRKKKEEREPEEDDSGW